MVELGSDEVIIQLINDIRLPCSLRGPATALNKTQDWSLEFTVNEAVMKVLRTPSLDALTECRLWFGVTEIKVLIAGCKWTFLTKFSQSGSELWQIFADSARIEFGSYSAYL